MENSTNRPEYAKYGTIYFIRHKSGSHKIGITLDWQRRSKELKVGTDCKALSVKQVENPGRLEKIVLRKYESNNLPGTEWLNNLKAEQIKDIKNLIGGGSKGYKQVFKSRKKHMVDLEMAIQDSPELLSMMESIEREKEEKRIKEQKELDQSDEFPLPSLRRNWEEMQKMKAEYIENLNYNDWDFIDHLRAFIVDGRPRRKKITMEKNPNYIPPNNHDSKNT